MLSKIKDRVEVLSKNLNFEYTESNDDSGILYYIICRDRDIAKHIFKCANSVDLDASLEEIPFSLSVNYHKIIIYGED